MGAYILFPCSQNIWALPKTKPKQMKQNPKQMEHSSNLSMVIMIYSPNNIYIYLN